MDDAVIRAMIKWPDVPDVHGWLMLDRRGNWRIRTESPERDPVFGPVGNVALREFIARNYAADSRGRWYFQNGPQRVFVRLAYTPYVFRIEGGAVSDQRGRQVDRIDGAWVDEEGSLLLGAHGSVGLLDDRDLGLLAEQVSDGILRLGSASITVGSVAAGDIESLFGFVRDPEP